MLRFLNRLGWFLVWTIITFIVGWFAGIMTYILVELRNEDKKPKPNLGPWPPGSPNWIREKESRAQEQQQTEAPTAPRFGYSPTGGVRESRGG